MQSEGHSRVTDSSCKGRGTGSPLDARAQIAQTRPWQEPTEVEPKGWHVNGLDCPPEDLGSGPIESGRSAQSGKAQQIKG